MTSYSVSQVFNIPENYSLEDLKKSYKNIIDNLIISNRTNIEKQLLANQYTELYRLGKNKFYQRTQHRNPINNIFDNFIISKPPIGNSTSDIKLKYLDLYKINTVIAINIPTITNIPIHLVLS